MQYITVSHRRTLISSAAHIGLTASLAVWLAVFAPMLCQYHGLMWNHTHTEAMADDASWDNPMPAMDMSSMEMTAAEHQEHLRSMHMAKHTAVEESPEQPVQHTVLNQAVLPLANTNTVNAASLYNPVPTIATMLVNIMLIHAPSQLMAMSRDIEPTRVQPESDTFPLQLTVPPLEQPPRL